nr:DnaJ domain-containing protein [Pelagibacterales bacterium]
MNLDRYFRTLGISDTKDIKSIKRAFMKVAKKYHPDKTQNNTNL